MEFSIRFLLKRFSYELIVLQMAYPSNPADRTDPMDNAPAMRARVPDHVASGQISTGVIVVTGATEYILDFVRNLPRPNMIVARVVLPHQVMPQFIDALSTNIGLYRQRFHDLNLSPSSTSAIQSFSEPNPVAFPPGYPFNTPGAGGSSKAKPGQTSTDSLLGGPIDIHAGASLPVATPTSESGSNLDDSDKLQPSSEGTFDRPAGRSDFGDSDSGDSTKNRQQSDVPSQSQPVPPPLPPSITRHPSPQEVYDELKLKDELLSGSYANAVMIGHGPHEFSFDFITNFYPQSAVSCRVFMAAGHVNRLLDSLRASWDQLKSRMG